MTTCDPLNKLESALNEESPKQLPSNCFEKPSDKEPKNISLGLIENNMLNIGGGMTMYAFSSFCMASGILISMECEILDKGSLFVLMASGIGYLLYCAYFIGLCLSSVSAIRNNKTLLEDLSLIGIYISLGILVMSLCVLRSSITGVIYKEWNDCEKYKSIMSGLILLNFPVGCCLCRLFLSIFLELRKNK